jgi:hypothetical protein
MPEVHDHISHKCMTTMHCPLVSLGRRSEIGPPGYPNTPHPSVTSVCIAIWNCLNDLGCPKDIESALADEVGNGALR